MDKQIFIPIVLFICATYAIKVIVDAYSRRKLFQIPGSREDILLALGNEADARRLSSLRWGLVLVAIAVGLGLLQVLNLREATAGVFAVLLGMTGLGHLVFFFLARHLR